MTAILEQLIQVRSRLTEEALAYLDGLAERSAELPKYYPERLRAAEAGKTPFDDVRQIVQVVEDRSAFERWLAEERERMRAAGQDFDRVAYKPKRSLMEDEESGERDDTRRDRPAPPPPFQWDENAGSRFKRAVILGDPGFGKTWLLRYETRRLARAAADQLRNRLCDLDQIMLPIFIRLSELNRTDNPIEDALIEAVSTSRSATFRNFVREKLATERCIVLLDAWDEVPIEVPTKDQPIALLPHHRQRLGQRLDTFARQFTQPRILMTSRIVGYDQSPIPDLPGQEKVKELELLAFNTPQIEAFVRVWFGEGDTANQFLTILRQNHQMRGLAQIPLMLTLLCRIWIESKEKKQEFPTRRVELYDRCLRGLLSDWKIDDKGHDKEEVWVSPAYVDAMIELLQEVGYELFVEGYEQFSPSLLRVKIMQCLAQLKPGHELYGSNAAELISKLKRDGLLITVGEHHDAPLLFLHRTFQEYLAASALAGRVQRAGWNSIEGFVSKKAWLPEWREVVTLLAGKLNDPVPLLEMLSNPEPTRTNPHGDDLLRHRLALAALCLPEARAGVEPRVSNLVDRITSDVFSIYWEHRRNSIDEMVSHLTRSLPALAQAQGNVQPARASGALRGAIESISPNPGPQLQLIDLACHLLRDNDWEAQEAAADVVGVIGAAAATSQILDRLTELLRDDYPMREAAVRAVGGIGAAAAMPQVLDRLTDLLRDNHEYVREAAARAVGGIGAAAATPEFLDRLTEWLRDDEWRVRVAAADAVGRIGAAAATPQILDHLTELLRDDNSAVQNAAGRAVGGIGATAATPQFLDRLTELLRDDDQGVRYTTADAVGGIGAAAATPQILDCIVELLRDDDSGGVRAAVWAVDRIGTAAATPQFLDRLTELLRDNDSGVQGAAARAVGGIGAAAATPQILDRLTELLRDDDRHMREAAAGAVGGIGAAAATPQILERLTELLRDDNRDVWVTAARAVGGIGATAAAPQILERLTELLRDDEWHVWKAAADAISRIGTAAATPQFLDRLTELLRDDDGFVQIAAVSVVGGIGAAAATPQILDRLAELLRDDDPYVWEAAARAVGGIGAAAATPQILDRLAELLPEYVRVAAADAVGGIGAAAATPEFLDRHAERLRDDNFDVRKAAAKVVAYLTKDDVRIFSAEEILSFIRGNKFVARSVKELSE